MNFFRFCRTTFQLLPPGLGTKNCSKIIIFCCCYLEVSEDLIKQCQQYKLEIIKTTYHYSKLTLTQKSVFVRFRHNCINIQRKTRKQKALTYILSFDNTFLCKFENSKLWTIVILSKNHLDTIVSIETIQGGSISQIVTSRQGLSFKNVTERDEEGGGS